MTYSSGSLIQAADYNTFATNINAFWGTGSGDSGWGQTAISSVSASGIVTATNWATLVNTLASSGTQTNTSETSRSAPTTGTLVSIFNNVATDTTNVTTNRGNATVQGSTSNTWTGSIAKTTNTGAGQAAWTITWTQTVTFASADAARYFWNAGGLVTLNMSKTSTGNESDEEWNAFVGLVGGLYISGRVNSAPQTINGTSYTGTTRIGGTGGTQNTLATTTGWYQLTAGAAATTLFSLNNTVSPYTGENITVTAAKNAGATVLTLVTTWTQPAVSSPGEITTISGGTDTTSPYASFGTAPAVLCRYIPPSTTYLPTVSWGTPAVASSVA